MINCENLIESIKRIENFFIICYTKIMRNEGTLKYTDVFLLKLTWKRMISHLFISHKYS